MKRLVLLATLISVPAFAADPPTTLLMPYAVIQAMRQYLGKQPHDDVEALINAIEGCAAVQVPNARGQIMDQGQCPAVSEALKVAHQPPPTAAK